MDETDTDTAPLIPTVYWRPGCGFCARLLTDLDRHDVAHRRVNIWEDADGAQLVRQANGGDELVPTVVVGATTLSNPSLAQVLDAMQE